MVGQIRYGINNFYYVCFDDKIYECKIKGKILGIDEKEYTPLVSGDFVCFEITNQERQQGLILKREPRVNSAERFNKKKMCPQVIGANFDQIVIISSTVSPEFRPRFIDRVLVTAPPNIEVIIVLNKSDLGVTDSTLHRLNYFEKIGYPYFIVSTMTGDNIEKLKDKLKNKLSLFIGQSGVGKSSLINFLDPTIDQRVGDVSAKYNKGKHTTNYAILLNLKDDISIIDTPGIREIEVYGVEPQDLHFHFIDFFKLSDRCFYSGCTHIDEPDCYIKKMVDDGEINSDRYLSYLNIYKNILDRKEY